jgi:hypothetical protein
VAKALNELSEVPGATGLITYKDSPLGRGLPKKDYAIVTFDREGKKFVVQEMVFPEKIPVQR